MKGSFNSFVDFVSRHHDGICGITKDDLKRGRLFGFEEDGGLLYFKRLRYASLEARPLDLGFDNLAQFVFLYRFNPRAGELRVVDTRLVRVNFSWSAFVASVFGDEPFRIEAMDGNVILWSSFFGRIAEAGNLAELHRESEGFATCIVDSVMEFDPREAIEAFVATQAAIPFTFQGQIEAPAREEIEDLVKANLEILFRNAVEAFEADDRVEIA